MKRLSPAFVVGFAAAVFMTIPFLKNIGCCMIIPGAGIIAVLLQNKLKPNTTILTEKDSIIIGLMTGLFTALFATGIDILLTSLFKSNDFTKMLPEIETTLRELIKNAPEESFSLMNQIREQIEQRGFSSIYTIMILTGNLIVYIPAGVMGGLLGILIIKKSNKN